MNYCYINPNNGAVTLSFTANNGAAGAIKFVLWKLADGTWEKLEKHVLEIGDQGNGSIVLETSSNALNENVLTWKWGVCTKMANVERAKFTLDILQNNETNWENATNRKLPQCSTGGFREFGGEIEFKVQTEQPENNLPTWTDVD